VFDLGIIDFLEIIKTVATALVDECISLSQPVEAPDTWLNELVKLGKMIVEEVLLFLVDDLHDAIVVSHNQHHIFAQDSELFLLCQNASQR
jgi:hypothetical protein